MRYRDYYRILGLRRDARAEDIKKAYRRLARQYHPDVCQEPGAEEKFKDVLEAHEILSDPERRAAYDLHGYRRPGAPSAPAWQSGSAVATPSSASAAEPAGATAAAETPFTTPPFFAFSGDPTGGPSPQAAPQPDPAPQIGRDVESSLTLTLEEIFHGTERRIDLAELGGEGTVLLKVPAGTQPGKRLRLAGKGWVPDNGGAAGDLYFIIDLAPHRHYRLEGNDIYMVTPILPWEAALGAKILVSTPGGEAKVRIPPGANSGRKIRLAGRGFPGGPKGAGNFFVMLQIVVPPQLSLEERALYEQLAELNVYEPRTGISRVESA